MGITVTTSDQQITASVGETKIDVSVSGGIGPAGPAGAAGASSWADITGKPSTFSPSAHAASHAVGGADALTPADIGAAAASDFDQGVKTTDTVAFFRIDLTGSLYGPYIGIASGAVELSEFGVTLGQGAVTYADDSVQTTAWTGSVDWSNVNSKPSTFAPTSHKSQHASTGSDPLSPSDIGAAALSHTHSAADITSGTVATARLASSGTASSSTFLRGDQTWATAGSTNASDLTSGTLAYARMADPTVTSPSQITASQNDYASFARGINRFTTNGAYNLTGMAAGNDGEVRVLTNVGTTTANTLTIKDESSSSTAANRFYVPWNGDCVIPAEGSVVVFYDGTSSRWRVV